MTTVAEPGYAPPISDYGLLSDRHSAALVSRDGSVDWLCFPRFDSPSVCGRLLDPDAGHWSIRPSAPYEVTRCYRERTMLIDTTFRTATGAVTLTDALLLGPGNGEHRLGIGVPHMLVRALRCTHGEVPIEVEYRPRPDYGLDRPTLSRVDGGLVCGRTDGRLVLTSPLELPDGGDSARGGGTLHEGDTLLFAMQWSTSTGAPARVWSQDTLGSWLEDTAAGWRSWSQLHQAYQGPWCDLVHHSGRVLQALSYQPSGAIVAAATTSLPEWVGGARNWDYRYSWVRDASLTMQALWVAACPDEADDYFTFMTGAAPCVDDAAGLQIMFGVGGERELAERVLPHLRGWRGSGPVRVGNDVWSQRQLDVYGELLDSAVRLVDQITMGNEGTRRLLVGCADAAARHWRETDHGLWEMRGPPRHFVHSKVMCWVALDRAIRLAAPLSATDRVPGWRRARDEIKDVVMRAGWHEQAGAFTQAFGSTELDASVLIMPYVGFIEGDHPKMVATIEAISERLTDPRGLVYRYRAAAGLDGVGGAEGTFLWCTFMLARAAASAGRLDLARRTFERAAAHVNDLGLLAEEVDPRTGQLLGNFPQAFSHVGLVNAAWEISEAERADRAVGEPVAGG